MAPFSPAPKAVVFDARTKQLSYTWLRSLMPDGYADFEAVTADALDFAMEQHGFRNDSMRERLMEQYFKLTCYPEVPAVLKQLREAGLKTAILSNGSPRMLDAAVSNSGLTNLLDAVLYADAVKVYKPDRRVYNMAVERFSIRPEEVLFVSSNSWDVHGASHHGFRVFWCNRKSGVDDRLPGKADVVGKDLTELPKALGL
ncbi:haloacid dehalogenase, type II [Hyaloraphidium curvatum]|nr:haloacid dehalogenase, type II [Hyaloraphidium curvatum]